jgi:hypothetical protein
MSRTLLALTLALFMSAAHAATFTVTTTADSGAGSLRDAVAQANAASDADVINFDVSGIILLTTGQLPIWGPVSIVGPGAGALAISGNAASRVFAIYENVADVCTTPNADYVVSISGLTLANSRVTFNAPGGAVYTEKTLVMDSVVISGNEGRAGGGLAILGRYDNQSAVITNSRFESNLARPFASSTAQSNGGAIAVANRCATAPANMNIAISNSVFADNETRPGTTYTASAGGAIWLSGQYVLSITDSRIINNAIRAQDPPIAGVNLRGGGISVGQAKALTLLRTEVSGNSAERAGGVRLVQDDPGSQGTANAMAVRIIDSTVSGNASEAPVATGAGIGAYGNVALEIYNSTVANNQAAAGGYGGIGLSAGPTTPATEANTDAPTLVLASTIVSNSAGGAPDIGVDGVYMTSLVATANQSLLGTLAAPVSVTGGGNLIGADALLGALAFNGGPTRTQALLSASPARNAGSNPLTLATDQRGFARTYDGVTDIGAYEAGLQVAALPVPMLDRLALAVLVLALLCGSFRTLARRR